MLPLKMGADVMPAAWDAFPTHEFAKVPTLPTRGLYPIAIAVGTVANLLAREAQGAGFSRAKGGLGCEARP